MIVSCPEKSIYQFISNLSIASNRFQSNFASLLPTTLPSKFEALGAIGMTLIDRHSIDPVELPATVREMNGREDDEKNLWG